MYVDNVRNTISRLEQGEYEEYLKRLRSVLRRKYSKNVKPSELKRRVDEFVSEKILKLNHSKPT